MTGVTLACLPFSWRLTKWNSLVDGCSQLRFRRFPRRSWKRCPDRNLSRSLHSLRLVRHVHIASEVTDALVELAKRAKHARCSVSIDWNGREIRGIAQADLNIMNLDEARRLVHSNDAAPEAIASELARQVTGSIVLTLGADGALQIDEHGNFHRAATEPVIPIDRSGGGDAFDAGVIVGCLRG